MGMVREHHPVVIEEINGLWDRGDAESCPLDHLLIADNIQFFHSGVETRQAVKPYLRTIATPSPANLANTRRIYNYNTQTGQTLLVLVEGGLLYHVISPTEAYNILNIAGMEDFAFISIAGRAYISPFKTYTNPADPPRKYSLALPNEFVYVYNRPIDTPVGTVVTARLAAGLPPVNGGKKPIIAYNNDIAGKVTEGYHVLAVAFNDGIVEMSLRVAVNAPGGKTIKVTNIPIGPVGTTSRTIVMTKAGIPYAPGVVNEVFKVATVPDNTTTSFVVDVADSEMTTVYVPGATPGPVLDAMFVFNPIDPGFCDTGFHLFAVVYETDTGYLSAPGPEFYTGQTLVDSSKTVRIINIPVAPAGSHVVKRHIVATKTIPEYHGDQKGYQFFFVPKGTLENNTATTIDVNFYDSDLIADASHLIDNFSKIPAGVNFCEYHARLVIVGDASYPKDTNGVEDKKKPDNRSVAWLSAPGEPEAINQIDGLIITPLDGNPLTNCQDFRDNLYLFKSARTYAVTDNQDEPSTWGPIEVLDQGIGASVHGIAEVLDSGGVNVDYLIITDWSGLMLFNGTYARPELSWKIEDIWMDWDRNEFHHLQIVNNSVHKKIWIVDPQSPTKILWLADYGNGLNPKDIRWARWYFKSRISSIALLNIDHLMLGTTQVEP